MKSSDPDVEPFVNLSELTKIELLIMRRMREVTAGEHRSSFTGSGCDVVGLRDWQPGDRASNIDWPQSTLNNFSPMVVREFEQRSTATIVAVADASLSTRCGIDGVPIATAIARAIGTIGMSAVFFQDMFGLITFDAKFELSGIQPRTGRNQVIGCLSAYQFGHGLRPLKRADTLSKAIASFTRKTSMVPVISDFLFDEAGVVIQELGRLNSLYDVFLILIDSAFAFELPSISAGWIEAFDIETGRSQVMSRRVLRELADRSRTWQDDVAAMAKTADLDVLRIGMDELHTAIALIEFIAERRLRKVV